jgi:hypothetical protein
MIFKMRKRFEISTYPQFKKSFINRGYKEF